jgi:hypothetical protein
VADVAAVGRRSRWSGIGIGVATAVKLVPGLFIVWLLFAGKRAAGGRAVLAAAAATALGWALAPADSRLYWTELIFNSGRIGRVDDPANNSLLSIASRALDPGHARTALWLVSAAVIVGIGLWRGVRAARRDDLLAATAIIGCAGALVSPISWTHHLGFAVLALAAFTARRPKPWAIVGLVGAWLLLVSPGGHGNEVSTSTIRVLAMIAIVVALPIVTGRSARGRIVGPGASAGDDAEHAIDELAATGLEVVAPDRHAAEHVGAPLGHERGELLEGLARVEGEGAEHGTPLAGEER